MIHTREQCSPQNLESPVYQVHKGADKHHTRGTISLTAGIFPLMHEHSDHETSAVLPQAKQRMTPVIWEARQELCSRGFFAIPVRGSSHVMIDLIAWDERIIYCIAVRRSRGEAGIRDITTRYDRLIRDLQTIRVPVTGEIQLWISIPHSFRVYRVLAGGLMSRNLP